MYLFRKDLQEKKPVFVNIEHKKVMLCLNESTLDPFKAINSQFLEKIKNYEINRYYSSVTAELKQKLAEYIGNGITENNLLFGNGADEMLYYLFIAVRQNEDSTVLSLAPSYFDYRSYSSAVGLNIKLQSLKSDFDFDTDEFEISLQHPEVKMAILCNPNNPTGNLLSDEKIMKIIRQTDKLVVIDETYFEFSGKTYVQLINEFPNLVIIRSFSKSFSSAGLRFGYLISCEETINEIKKVFTAFNSSVFIQIFALTILENREIFQQQTLLTKTLRDNLFAEMSAIPGLRVFPSHTNFLLFTIGERTKELFSFLSENEIAIRAVWHHPVLNNCVRVTIGSETENKLFLYKVNEFMQAQVENHV